MGFPTIFTDRTGRPTMKTTHFALVSTALSALLLFGLSLPDAASADDRSRSERRASERSHEASAHKQPAPHRTSRTDRDFPAPGTANRQPNRHFPRDYYLNRPGGSALNAPPGYYRDNLSYDPPPRHRRGRDGHGQAPVHAPAYAPTYVVVPPLFPHDGYSEPLAIGPTRGPEDAVEPLDLQADDPYGREPVREPARYAPRQPASVHAPDPIVYEVPNRAPAPHPTAPAEPDKPKAPQPIHLDIVPADAAVWLDDEYLGRASELTASVVLQPGVYLLEVEHEDLPDERLFFGVVDQPVDVRVDLGATEPRRRYRVR